MSENVNDDPFKFEGGGGGPGGSFLVVGIGASAGGIGALREFFGAVPADSRMAYVVILHLSPEHESRLAEVLQQSASVPVVRVAERVRVEPDRVYVVSPNQSLKLLDGHLEVSEVQTAEERSAPVDIFFRTLELAEANVAMQAEISQRIRTERSRVRLFRQIVRAQEDERRRIARDIHDQLGQQMTALRLILDALSHGSGGDPEALRKIEQAQAIAVRLDADVDFLAWELRPAALDDLGLLEALRNFVREWSRHSGITADFHASGVDEERLAPEAETALYRITQEALNNVQKYARATRADVLLERRDQHVVLIVEDDGSGFNPQQEADRGNGLGLFGMRERATLVGGTLEVESTPGEGTAVFARVPVRLPEEEEES